MPTGARKFRPSIPCTHMIVRQTFFFFFLLARLLARGMSGSRGNEARASSGQIILYCYDATLLFQCSLYQYKYWWIIGAGFLGEGIGWSWPFFFMRAGVSVPGLKQI